MTKKKKRVVPLLARWERPRQEQRLRETLLETYYAKEMNIVGDKHLNVVRTVPDLAEYSAVLHTLFAPRWIVNALQTMRTERMAERLLKRAARNPSLLRIAKTGVDLGGDFNQVVEMALKLRKKEPDGG